MNKPLLVASMLAALALGFAGCDEEAEDGDEDTDSEIVPEPEPNTEIPPGPDDDGESDYYQKDLNQKAKAARGF